MKKILLLFGGNSSEYLVSCRSAKCILENIDKNIYDVTAAGISKDNTWFIFKDDYKYLEDGTWLERPSTKEIINPISFIKDYDVLFPIIHGTNGEDGRLQGFLDLLEVPYVGCKTLSSALGMDKAMAKKIFDYHHIPQVPFLTVSYDYDILGIEQHIDYPMIVKPCNGGSSIGISKANNLSELKESIKLALTYDKEAIIEHFVNARELECAILVDNGIKVSDIGEILSANEFYDYNAKYENNKSRTVIPALLDPEISLKIKEYAKSAFQAINGSNLARVDFLYDEANKQIYLNEINTLPGFNTISMYPMLCIAMGYTYKELITTLIENV